VPAAEAPSHGAEAGVLWVLNLLAGHLDGTGAGIVAYARALSRRHRIDIRSALAVAKDALDGESDATCEALAVLLTDEWDASIGEAVAAARRI